MINSNDCKDLIIDYVIRNWQKIRIQWDPPLEARHLQSALKKGNWKRLYKQANGATIERLFDCRPFDDQMRGYVWEDTLTGKVECQVVGE